MTQLFPIQSAQIVATPASLDALASADHTARQLLNRHLNGDWGDVSDGDAALNNQALQDGSRLLSVYRLSDGITIWVITDAANDRGQREATTILLPEEY